MKFRFTFTPLHGLKIGDVVDKKYRITHPSYTGRNAQAYLCNALGEAIPPHESITLIYSTEPIKEQLAWN